MRKKIVFLTGPSKGKVSEKSAFVADLLVRKKIAKYYKEEKQTTETKEEKFTGETKSKRKK